MKKMNDHDPSVSELNSFKYLFKTFYFDLNNMYFKVIKYTHNPMYPVDVFTQNP